MNKVLLYNFKNESVKNRLLNNSIDELSINMNYNDKIAVNYENIHNYELSLLFYELALEYQKLIVSKETNTQTIWDLIICYNCVIRVKKKIGDNDSTSIDNDSNIVIYMCELITTYNKYIKLETKIDYLESTLSEYHNTIFDLLSYTLNDTIIKEVTVNLHETFDSIRELFKYNNLLIILLFIKHTSISSLFCYHTNNQFLGYQYASIITDIIKSFIIPSDIDAEVFDSFKDILIDVLNKSKLIDKSNYQDLELNEDIDGVLIYLEGDK